MKDQLMCSEVRNVLGVSYIPEFPCRIRQKLDGCLPFYPSMFYFSTFWSVSSENISLINYLHANLISGSTLWWSKLSHSEKKMWDFDWDCAECIDQIQENWQKSQYWVFQSRNMVCSSIWATVLWFLSVMFWKLVYRKIKIFLLDS